MHKMFCWGFQMLSDVNLKPASLRAALLVSPQKRIWLKQYPSEHLFMIYSHFWAVLQAEGAGHRWWAVGFAYRVLQRCWTMPMLPPFAHWPSGASSVQVGCSEHRHQPLPGSVGLSRSQCSRWSEEPGSGGQVRQVSLITSLQNV